MREFYIDFLGFSVLFEHRFDPEAPLYCALRRGACELHLSEHHGDASPGGAVRIETDEIDELQRELSGKGYKHANPGIHDTPYGTREVTVTDPFGNRLIFFRNL